jgi:hypothetical protein
MSNVLDCRSVGHTLHDTTESIEDCLRCEVLRGDEIYEVLLSVFLLQFETYKHRVCCISRVAMEATESSRTFSMIWKTVGSAFSRSADRSWGSISLSSPLQERAVTTLC